jgi:citrate synthase
MPTRNMSDWQTAICQVISNEEEEKIIVRNHDLDDLIGNVSFSAMMFLMLQGRLPSEAQTRVLDALMVGSMEHGIAPPSMIARCHASYGTPLPTAIGAGVSAFGDRMGGLGERLAQLMVERLSDLPADEEPADEVLAERARTAVEDIAARGGRVPGFGIPLHGRDPRAPGILAVARREGTFLRYCRFAAAIENALTAARGGRPVPMNLDGVGAAVILDLGFDWRSTQMFLLTPRTVSFGAHYLEEQDQDSTWRHIPADQIEYIG